MKKTILFSAMFATVFGWSQQIDNVIVRQRWPWSKLVDINYLLTAPVGESYDVTVQAFNGETPLTIPSSAFVGDINRVAEGSRHIVLDPSKVVATNVQILTQFKVQLVPVVTPLYMIVDLTKAAGMEGQIEYVYEEALTNGLWGTWERNPVNGVQSVIWTGVTNDIYKTDKLVLRRVHAGIFNMGDSVPPTISTTLTKESYAGVFEVTQRQWELITGEKPSYYNSGYYATRPVERVSYEDIRGATDSVPSVNWPVTDRTVVSANSFLGKLRAKTGMTDFDLPTEAQWGYLCRAGTQTYYNDGLATPDNTTSNAQMDVLGRYQYNGGTAAGTAAVGSYQPNAWGLYDTHGNVWEWCLNWASLLTGGSDPSGVVSGSWRTFLGGSAGNAALGCRSASRDGYVPSLHSSLIGFRLVRTLP